MYLFEGLGIRHGISMDKLLDASDFICSFLKRRNQSRVATALLAARKKASAAAAAYHRNKDLCCVTTCASSGIVKNCERGNMPQFGP